MAVNVGPCQTKFLSRSHILKDVIPLQGWCGYDPHSQTKVILTVSVHRVNKNNWTCISFLLTTECCANYSEQKRGSGCRLWRKWSFSNWKHMTCASQLELAYSGGDMDWNTHVEYPMHKNAHWNLFKSLWMEKTSLGSKSLRTQTSLKPKMKWKMRRYMFYAFILGAG